MQDPSPGTLTHRRQGRLTSAQESQSPLPKTDWGSPLGACIGVGRGVLHRHPLKNGSDIKVSSLEIDGLGSPLILFFYPFPVVTGAEAITNRSLPIHTRMHMHVRAGLDISPLLPSAGLQIYLGEQQTG